MAATYTSTACQTTAGGFFLNPPKYIENGVVARSAVMTLPWSASNTAVAQMVPVPKGCQIVDVILAWDTAGTTTQFTFNVGDGNATGRFITSISATGSGVAHAGYGIAFSGSNVQSIYSTQGGIGYSYSAEDTVDVFATAVASGSTTPAGTIRLTVLYSMDQSTDGAS